MHPDREAFELIRFRVDESLATDTAADDAKQTQTVRFRRILELRMALHDMRAILDDRDRKAAEHAESLRKREDPIW